MNFGQIIYFSEKKKLLITQSSVLYSKLLNSKQLSVIKHFKETTKKEKFF